MTLKKLFSLGICKHQSHLKIFARNLGTPRELAKGNGIPPVKGKKLQTKVATHIPRLIRQKHVNNIAATLKEHLKPDICIVECFPGEGLLTRELLNLGLKNVSCWEPEEKYVKNLEELSKKNKSLFVHRSNIFHEKTHPKDNRFEAVPKKPWEDDVHAQMICFLHPDEISLWISRNAYHMASGSFPHSMGRAEIFGFVTGREHQLMIEKDMAVGAMKGPIPKRSTVDYELFYDITSLLKVPGEAFDRSVDFGQIPKTANWDQKNFFLVKITPKPNLFEIVPKDDFRSFLLFVKQLLRLRTPRLIPKLESWCPGLGLLAIELDYTMMDTIQQVQAKHLPILFREFKAKGGIDALESLVVDSIESPSYQSGTNIQKDVKDPLKESKRTKGEKQAKEHAEHSPILTEQTHGVKGLEKSRGRQENKQGKELKQVLKEGKEPTNYSDEPTLLKAESKHSSSNLIYQKLASDPKLFQVLEENHGTFRTEEFARDKLFKSFENFKSTCDIDMPSTHQSKPQEILEETQTYDDSSSVSKKVHSSENLQFPSDLQSHENTSNMNNDLNFSNSSQANISSTSNSSDNNIANDDKTFFLSSPQNSDKSSILESDKILHHVNNNSDSLCNDTERNFKQGVSQNSKIEREDIQTENKNDTGSEIGEDTAKLSTDLFTGGNGSSKQETAVPQETPKRKISFFRKLFGLDS